MELMRIAADLIFALTIDSKSLTAVPRVFRRSGLHEPFLVDLDGRGFHVEWICLG